MSVRSLGYDSENLDSIICYFMRTILRIQNSGIEKLPVENTLVEPWKTYLDTAMKLFIQSPAPQAARLILEAEYDAILSSRQIPAETAMGLKLIEELTWHIHYDENCYEYLLSTDILWENTAYEYATYTFYPNLPEEIKDRFRIRELIAHVPENMFRMKDY